MPFILPMIEIIALSASGGLGTDPRCNALQALQAANIETTRDMVVYYSDIQGYFYKSNWYATGPNSYGDADSNWTIYDHGYFALYVLFDYLDRVCSDLVIDESNDWIAEVDSFTYPWEKAALSVADYRSSQYPNIKNEFSFISSFLASHEITYDPSQNSSNGVWFDDYFWKNSIDAYLDSKGFDADEGTSPWLVHDYNITYGRNGIFFEGYDTYVGTPQARSLQYAVDNGLPAIFGTNANIYGTYAPYYPFFCYGYVKTTIGGYETLSFLGYSPYCGPIAFGENYLSFVSVVDFHVPHIYHSNNIVLNSSGFAYCACGQRTCYQVHDYHYHRINNSYHRKTCVCCSDSHIEPHQGNYCICMLDD